MILSPYTLIFVSIVVIIVVYHGAGSNIFLTQDSGRYQFISVLNDKEKVYFTYFANNIFSKALLMSGWQHKMNEKLGCGRPAENTIFQCQTNTEILPVISEWIQSLSFTVQFTRRDISEV